MIGRQEPDEPRGSRPDLWGAVGEIPAAYPAADQKTGPARQVAEKRQPGRTAPAVHQTGTVPTQDGTAT